MPSLASLLSFLALATNVASNPLQPRIRNQTPGFDLTNITYSSSTVYSTPAHLATYGGTIAFTVANTIPGTVPYVTKCSARGVHLQDMFYGEIIYTCEQPAGVPGSTNFTFSRPGNAFTVNQTYTDCYGLTWTGQASGSVDLKCKSETWQNQNWTMGQLYSTYTTTCEPASLSMGISIVTPHFPQTPYKASIC